MKFNDIRRLTHNFPIITRGSDIFLIPDEIAKIVWEEYNKEYPGQSFETIKERGGFSLREIIYYLYSRIDGMELKK
jgi:hypothetical protein